MQPQFNHNALRAESPDAKDPAKVLEWLNKQFARMNSALRGPHAIARTDTTIAVSIEPGLADLTKFSLTQNTTVTLPTDQVRAGTEGSIEFVQVGGSWTVTWINVYWPSGTPAPINFTIGERTLLRFMFDGTSWTSTSERSTYAIPATAVNNGAGPVAVCTLVGAPATFIVSVGSTGGTNNGVAFVSNMNGAYAIVGTPITDAGLAFTIAGGIVSLTNTTGANHSYQGVVTKLWALA